MHLKMHETPINVLRFLRKRIREVPKRQLAMFNELILKLNLGHPKLMLQALLKLRNRRIKQQLLPRVEEQDQRKDQPNEDRELERIYQHLEELYYQEFLGD